MWNFWTGFLPFGLALTAAALLFAVMAFIWLLGSFLIWYDECKEARKKHGKIRKVIPRRPV